MCLKNSKEVLPLRCVLSFNPTTDSWMRLFTHLPRDIASASDIGKLYHLRWQVELMFKEFKSHTNLKKFLTNKKNIAVGLIYASLCTAFLKRFLASRCQKQYGVSISNFRLGMCSHILRDTLRYINEGILLLERRLDVIFLFMFLNTQRTNPGREHRTGRMAAGLCLVEQNT